MTTPEERSALKAKMDIAAEMRAKLNALELEITYEREVEKLKQLLSDLRDHWERMFKLVDDDRPAVGPETVSALRRRLHEVIGPWSSSRLQPDEIKGTLDSTLRLGGLAAVIDHTLDLERRVAELVRPPGEKQDRFDQILDEVMEDETP